MIPNFYPSKNQQVTLDLSIKCLKLLSVISMIFLQCASTLLYEEISTLAASTFVRKKIFVTYEITIRMCGNVWE